MKRLKCLVARLLVAVGLKKIEDCKAPKLCSAHAPKKASKKSKK